MRCGPYAPVGWDGRPLLFDPLWRTETVVALALGVETGGRFDRLPILADALQEAGCELSEVLDHCRMCDQHRTDCWSLNLVLARPTVPDPPTITADQQIRLERLRRMSGTQSVSSHGRLPKDDTIPLSLIVVLALTTLGTASWIAYDAGPIEWTPVGPSVPNPYDSKAFTGSKEWREAKSQIDSVLRSPRVAGQSVRAKGANLPGP